MWSNTVTKATVGGITVPSNSSSQQGSHSGRGLSELAMSTTAAGSGHFGVVAGQAKPHPPGPVITEAARVRGGTSDDLQPSLCLLRHLLGPPPITASGPRPRSVCALGPAEPGSCTEWWQSPCQCSGHGPDCKLEGQGIRQEEGTRA